MPDSASAHGRFGALDGMRGVAAIMVVLLHIGNLGLGPFKPQFGYLAVDLFFALSGFVISYSYDPRLARGMTVGTFMLRRIIRLYPLYLIGSLVGFMTTPIIVNNPALVEGLGSPHFRAYLLITGLLNVAFVPGILPMLFPFNTPMWSLFFELWICICCMRLFGRE